MGLLTALHTASSSLGALAAKSEIASRNVATANTPYATQKRVGVIATPYGVTLSPTARTTDESLYENVLAWTSSAAQQQAVVDGLDSLNATIGDTADEQSPAAFVSKLQSALQTYSTSPADPGAAQAAVTAASALANSLNSASQTITNVRTDAENQISASVNTINSLVSQFDSINRQIVDGTIRDVDVTDSLDQRDQILANLSEQIGVKAMKGTNNNTSLYTDGGALLYDMNRYDPATPMVKCSFTQNPKFTSQENPTDQDKNITSITIDGHDATCGSSKSDTISSGKIAGLVQIHDESTTIYRSQLDEMARSLIVSFSEKDGALSSGIAHTGLFTATNLLTATDHNNSDKQDITDQDVLGTLYIADPNNTNNIIDPTNEPIFGLAKSIAISKNISATPTSLMLANSTDLTTQLTDTLRLYNVNSIDSLSNPTSTQSSILGFASSSVSWLSQTRQSATSENDFRSTLLQHGTDSLSKETGINIDDEMTDMLQLERAYQASSKVISVIDAMFNSLLQAV